MANGAYFVQGGNIVVYNLIIVSFMEQKGHPDDCYTRGHREGFPFDRL